LRDSQECTRRTHWIATAAFPVAKRLLADAHHRGELSTRLTENPPNFTDIDRFELATVSRAWAFASTALREGAREHKRVAHRVGALRPLSWLMKNVALSLLFQ